MKPRLATYSRNHPFLAKIKDRYTLCQGFSDKNTFHLVLDISGSNLDYEVGDSLAILPQNPNELVDKTVKALNGSGDVIVQHRNGNFYPLKILLKEHLNLSHLTKKLVTKIAEATLEKGLLSLLQEGNEENLKHFLAEFEVGEFLEHYPPHKLMPQEICSTLSPLLPRFYSVASTPLCSPNQIHLTVSYIQNYAGNKLRTGICCYYLWDELAIGDSLSVYLQPHRGFTLPKDTNIPIIMVGPGTGIAPFRGFMEERALTSPASNWLFFGECHQACHFFYRDFWNELLSQNKLRLDTAFSRDQHHKIYVQDRMLENSRDFFNWLEMGAILYVCGNADRMAKDVDRTLHQIVGNEGGLNPSQAEAYIKNLRHTKRYLCDVY